MPNKKVTSIEFTAEARKRLERLIARDTVKNIVSAGIVLFSKLTEYDRSQLIAEAIGSTNNLFDPYSAEEKLNRILTFLSDNKHNDQTTASLKEFCEEIVRLLGYDNPQDAIACMRKVAEPQVDYNTKIPAEQAPSIVRGAIESTTEKKKHPGSKTKAG